MIGVHIDVFDAQTGVSVLRGRSTLNGTTQSQTLAISRHPLPLLLPECTCHSLAVVYLIYILYYKMSPREIVRTPPFARGPDFTHAGR